MATVSSVTFGGIDFGKIIDYGAKIGGGLVAQAPTPGQQGQLDKAIQAGLNIYRGLGGSIPGDNDMAELNNRYSELSRLIYTAQSVRDRVIKQTIAKAPGHEGQAASLLSQIAGAITQAQAVLPGIKIAQDQLNKTTLLASQRNLSQAGIAASTYYATKRTILSRFSNAATNLQGAINQANAASDSILRQDQIRTPAQIISGAGRVISGTISQAGGTILEGAEGVGQGLISAAPYTKYLVWGGLAVAAVYLVSNVRAFVPRGRR